MEDFRQKEEKRGRKRDKKPYKGEKSVEIDEEEELREAMEKARLAHMEVIRKRKAEASDAQTSEKVQSLNFCR